MWLTSQITNSVDITESVDINQPISINQYYPIEASNIVRVIPILQQSIIIQYFQLS